MTLAAPAAAPQDRHQVLIAAGRLDEAMLQLGRQTGVSIGIRDQSLAGLRVNGVRGRMSAGEALDRLLRQTGAQARRVAPFTYLVERGAPPRPVPMPVAARRDPPPPPAPDTDIVVTASKRDVPLGSYPGGVQIVDGDDVTEAEASRGTDAIATRLASLASTHLGPGRNKLFIRGIADSSFVGPTQATVGQYWGNSRISYNAPDPSLRLYDIGRIEVLEGPQGTLYGAGSLGGVLRVVPRAPDMSEVEGRGWGGVQLVEHGDPAADIGGLVNVPLVEGSLAFRALAFGSVEGGYIDDRQRGLDDVNRVRTFGGRAGLRWMVDGWTVDASALGQRIDGDDAQYADREGDGLTRSSAFAQPYRNEYWLGELVGRKRWNGLELTVAVGHSRQYVSETFEGVDLPDPAIPFPRPVAADAEVYRQQNRIDLTNWEARLADQRADGTGWLIAMSGLYNHGLINRQLGERNSTLTGVRNDVTEATLYGEGTVRLGDGLTVTGGGRLTWSRLTGDAEDAPVTIAFRTDPGARAGRSEVRLLPSAAFAWKAMQDLTVFGRFQQGFRPGGLAVRRDFIERFDGDRLSTLEGGARFDRSDFGLTASVSWTNWANIQADLIDGYGFPATVNIGDGRVLTFGLSGKWRPSPALELDASLYLNSSKVTETFEHFFAFDEQPVEFSRLPNVADVSARLGGSYRTEVAGLDAAFTGYLRYIGQSTLGVGPVLGRLQGNYLDSGAELRIGREGRMLSFSLTNILDQRGNRFALGTPFLIRDQDQVTPMRPRALRLGVELGF